MVILLGLVFCLKFQIKVLEILVHYFRPPYVPASIDAFVGFTKNKSFKAKRLTPLMLGQKNNGKFVEAGLWYRSQWYSKKNEKNWLDTVNREVLNVRKNVGFCDVSTLGKIDIQGKRFIRIY